MLYYKYKVLRDTKTRSAILQNKIPEIRKFRPVIKEINLNADRKRIWLGRIESIDSKIMNESMPISFNIFKKEEI